MQPFLGVFISVRVCVLIGRVSGSSYLPRKNDRGLFPPLGYMLSFVRALDEAIYTQLFLSRRQLDGNLPYVPLFKAKSHTVEDLTYRYPLVPIGEILRPHDSNCTDTTLG